MKKNFFRALVMFMTIGSTLLFTACGDDNNDEPTPPTPPTPDYKYSEVTVNYSLDLSEDYYNLWDIQVTYTTYGGEIKTEIVDRDWVMEYTYNQGDDMPGEFVFNVVGVAKNPLPEPVKDKIYHFARSTQFSAIGKTVAGGTTLLGGTNSAISSSFEARGDKLSDRLTKGIKITEGKYTISK